MDAFVLPVPGKSLGVVFWGGARRRSREATGSEFSYYAPGELSAGEAAELQAAYLGSIGQALEDGDRTGGARGLLLMWWIAGILAAVVLAVRALDFGPGYSWIALVAVITTLPYAAGKRVSPFGSARHAAARRAAQSVTSLPVVAGADARTRDRLNALWQFARRQRGSEMDQLGALEGFCRENAWPGAARVYADLRAPREPAMAPRRRLRIPAPRRDATPPYAAVEMKPWP